MQPVAQMVAGALMWIASAAFVIGYALNPREAPAAGLASFLAFAAGSVVILAGFVTALRQGAGQDPPPSEPA